ncbi:hypothetical protein Pan44_14080 [Caulifigura coniformis]|uniref:Uncharacterized protein n=1 Tax=Caulifigura coniformis TaxID=2527983 RepID=A0A517SB74_9PLAN|nr:hypothetical protein [Caulifigura coniformis]QDT53391.1 hypothetical protein Pan44_14080 [Caulifigura coniformis]
MSFRTDLSLALASLKGVSSPSSITLHNAAGLTLRIEFTVVDSLSCAFREMTLEVPGLQSAAFATIEAWARNLSQRITYLLEQIGPLEIDPNAGEVLIRSTPPDQLPDGTQYYEIMLSQQAGAFVLKRYRSIKGTPGRTQVDLQVTHEVLYKLVDDLEASAPTP